MMPRYVVCFIDRNRHYDIVSNKPECESQHKFVPQIYTDRDLALTACKDLNARTVASRFRNHCSVSNYFIRQIVEADCSVNMTASFKYYINGKNESYSKKWFVSYIKHLCH